MPWLLPNACSSIAPQPVLGPVKPDPGDAEPFRFWLRDRGTEAVIPSTRSRKTPFPLDRKAYARRNVVERLFCRLKSWRRIHTRYDRLARNYLSAIALVSAVTAWTV